MLHVADAIIVVAFSRIILIRLSSPQKDYSKLRV